MEKRLLLAFILSFAILYLWSALFPQPKPPRGVLNSVQVTEIKDVTEGNPLVIKKQEQAPSSLPEHTETLENQKLRITLSNIGGKINEIYLKEYSEALPLSNILVNSQYAQTEFQVTNSNSDSISFYAKVGELEIIKQFSLDARDYMVNVQIEVKNNGAMSNLDISKIVGFQFDAYRMDNKLKQSRDLGLMDYAVNINDVIEHQGSLVKYSSSKEQFIVTQKETQISKGGPLKWVGLRNKYFCFILKPNNSYTQTTISNLNDDSLRFELASQEPSSIVNFQIYNGPQRMDILKGYGLDGMMKFSRFGLLDVICKFIYNVLLFVHKIIPSWGICILVLGSLIYGLTFPLTLKSMSSMKKIQSLQPKIAQLKEQHKNNPQKLSKEQMELFKEHKVNPLGGCLPMVLQMPIFIGFYQVLWRSVMFKGEGFLWIKDLSEPDRLFMLGSELPIIGNEFNILPFLMGIVMFFQQKFSSRNMSTSDPAQAQQQKMMTMLMPVMMVFIFYKAASGLTLYFTYFYLLTTFTQWKLSKQT